jgi:hypothetical protein
VRVHRKRIALGCGGLLLLVAIAGLLAFTLGNRVIALADDIGLETVRPLPRRVGVRAGEDLFSYVGQHIDRKGYEAVLIFQYDDTRSDGREVRCYLRSVNMVGMRPKPFEGAEQRGPHGPLDHGPSHPTAVSETVCNCYSPGDSQRPITKCELPLDLPSRWRG